MGGFLYLLTKVSEARADTCKPPDKGETQTIDPTDRPSRFAGIMERDYHHMPGWYSDTHSFLHLEISKAFANIYFYSKLYFNETCTNIFV